MDNSQRTLVVTCDESIDITIVHELHAHLNKAIQDQQSVELDAGQVERADTAVIQSLAAFFRAAAGAGLTVKWRSASEELKNAVALIGMSEALHLEANTSG